MSNSNKVPGWAKISMVILAVLCLKIGVTAFIIHRGAPLEKDTQQLLELAEKEGKASEKLQLLHQAMSRLIYDRQLPPEEKQKAMLQLLERMQTLQREHKLPPAEPVYGLDIIYSDYQDTPDFMLAFIRSGLFELGPDGSDRQRQESSNLLRRMLTRLEWLRHGPVADAHKPVILELLRHGAKTMWSDGEQVFNWNDADDPVLTAVLTRDAEFLRAVLATGCPARGTQGDGRPETEARWQNSPDLVELLRSH